MKTLWRLSYEVRQRISEALGNESKKTLNEMTNSSFHCRINTFTNSSSRKKRAIQEDFQTSSHYNLLDYTPRRALFATHSPISSVLSIHDFSLSFYHLFHVLVPTHTIIYKFQFTVFMFTESVKKQHLRVTLAKSERKYLFARTIRSDTVEHSRGCGKGVSGIPSNMSSGSHAYATLSMNINITHMYFVALMSQYQL